MTISLFFHCFIIDQDKLNKSTSERKFDLEEENKKLVAQLNIENFSLSRIPRPDDRKDEGTQLKK